MATDELRKKRLEELIHQTVAEVVHTTAQPPAGVFITVSGVVLSANHQHATVRVTVYPFEQSNSILASLGAHVKEIQHMLNQALRIRHVPKLQFVFDDSEERAQRIYSLLDSDNQG